MGRSVSTPSGATCVAYSDWFQPELEPGEDYRPPDQDDWDIVTEDLTEYAPTLWPSLQKCDHWLGREDHALLENDHAFVGVSEYCGLAAFWIVPKCDDWTGEPSGLAAHWCDQISDKFRETFGTLRKIATASNGEAFFERITKN